MFLNRYSRIFQKRIQIFPEWIAQSFCTKHNENRTPSDDEKGLIFHEDTLLKLEPSHLPSRIGRPINYASSYQ